MLLLAASASPPRVLAPRAAAAPPELTVRPARWPDDYDAVCAVRKPTEFVVESGGAGFMGQKVVIDDPEEAQKRRVQARLGSALRDKATVLLAEDPSSGAVVGTLDCVLQQHAAEPSAAPQPRLCAAHHGSRGPPSSPPPVLSHRGWCAVLCRRLLRNLWVEPSLRRQGLARRLMAEAEDLARAEAEGAPTHTPRPRLSHRTAHRSRACVAPLQQPCSFCSVRGGMAGRLYLDVRADNTPALTLYEALGFEELDPPAWPVPAFMRGSLAMTKEV